MYQDSKGVICDATDCLFQVSQNPGPLAYLVPNSSSWSLPFLLLSSPDPRGRGSGPSLQMENVINNQKNIQEEETRKTTWGRPRGGGPCPGPWDSSGRPPAALSGNLPQEWVILAKSEKEKPPNYL